MPRPVSVSTALFDGHGLDAAIAGIAAAGARFIEPAFIEGYVPFDEGAFSTQNAATLRRSIENAGLRPLAVSAHMNLASPGACEMLARRIDFTAGLGSGMLISNAGATSARAAILKVLEGAAKRCEEAGVVLALENPGHGAADLLPNGRAGAALARELASPFLRLNYDAGNILTYSRGRLSPEHDFHEACPFTAHLHLKDVRITPEGFAFSAIGDGDVDFAALWPALPKDMPVGIELPLRLARPGFADPVRRPEPLPLAEIERALRKSLDYVRHLEMARQC